MTYLGDRSYNPRLEESVTTRHICPSCGNVKDVMVGRDGFPADWRDTICSCGEAMDKINKKEAV